MITNARTLVTGGSGFIGSNLCEDLLRLSNEVTSLDLENKNAVKGVKFVQGSIMNKELLSKSFKDIDYVFHLAAIPRVSYSVEHPYETSEPNIMGTINVLLAARDAGVKKVVFASSSSIYGDCEKFPQTEDSLPNPKSPYALTKLVGEHYMRLFNELYGLQTVSLRFFNVYGPRQDPHSQYAVVIPKFILQAMNNQALTIEGDGEQSRDFTYVKDVAQACIKAAEHKGSHDVFNVGVGETTTINELAGLTLKNLGKELIPVHGPARIGDVKKSCADITKAKKALGYEPQYDLERGLKETINWFKSCA